MTTWKKERVNFDYYITNQRKSPVIRIEFKGIPDDRTCDLLHDYGLHRDGTSGTCWTGLEFNENRLWIAHDLDRIVGFKNAIRYQKGLKQYLSVDDITFVERCITNARLSNVYIRYNDKFEVYQKTSLKMIIDPEFRKYTVIDRRKEKETYYLDLNDNLFKSFESIELPF